MMTSFVSLATILAGFAVLPLSLQTGSQPTAPVQTAPTVTEGPAVPMPVTGPARDALLVKVADALEAVRTAKGRFSQLGADYQFTEGAFALRRPGRIRFDYDDPSPILIVADGTTVAIEDSELETFDRVPLGATPLGLLLDRRIDFEEDANVLELLQTPTQVLVTLEDRAGENEGTLTLVLEGQNLTLVGWRTVDAAGGITTVELRDVETNIRINPRTFVINDPEDEDEE